MLERLKRLLGFGPDAYALLQLSPERKEIDRIEQPFAKDLLEFRYPDLDDGIYQLREVPRKGRFGDSVWKREIGDVDRAREREDLREEIRSLKREMRRDGGGGKSDRPLKDRAINAVLSGELDPETLETIAALNATWESPDDVSVSDLVDDPTDLGAVVGASGVKMLDGYDSIDELIEDLTAGAGRGLDEALSGGAGETDNTDAQLPDQDRAEEQPEDGQQDDEPAIGNTEARYRVRFPSQYSDAEVEVAREVLDDETIEDLTGGATGDEGEDGESDDEAGQQDVTEVDADADAGAEVAADGGAEDGEQPVPDGGIDPLEGTGRETRDGALREFRQRVRERFSGQEIEHIAERSGIPRESVREAMDMVVQFDGLAFPGGRPDRRRFLRKLARQILDDPPGRNPRPDGGRVQQPLIERLDARHISGAIFVLMLLFGGDR